MVFNNINDIKNNLYNNISNYIIKNINDIDISMIIFLIRSYLRELKLLNEVNNFLVTYNGKLIFIKIDKDYIDEFTINIDNEIRKLKIKRIKNDNNIKKFVF
ncbi:MAG: hypothetical protein WDA02_08460 [Saccharofermentanales bacterium]